MTPSYRPRSSLVHGVLVAVLAVVVGVVAGHFAWSKAATVRLNPAGNRTLLPSRSYGSDSAFGGSGEYGSAGSGEYGSEYGSGRSGLFGPGGNAEGAGSSEGAGSGEGGG